MHKRLFLRALVAGLALSLLLTGGAEADLVVLLDPVFDDQEWDQTVMTSGNGGAASKMQVASGNPGPAAEITISVNQPGAVGSGVSSAAWIFSINSNQTYDPSAGAILSIDYFEDAILLDGAGSGHASALALRQDEVLYLALVDRIFTPETNWTAKSILDLEELDFRTLTSTARPDFSTGGSLIEFGYVRGLSSPEGSSAAQRITSIDNWRVEITTVPTPSAGALLGLALGMLAMRFCSGR